MDQQKSNTVNLIQPNYSNTQLRQVQDAACRLSCLNKQVVELAGTDLNIEKLQIAFKNLQKYQNIVNGGIEIKEDLILEKIAGSILNHYDSHYVKNNEVITVKGSVKFAIVEKASTFTVKVKEKTLHYQ